MATTAPALDIGALKSLRILCISETGWFDTATVFGDIRAAGGAQSDQYSIPWPPFGPLHAENAAGFSALLEAEAIDGSVRRLLFDTGWNPDWMDRRFAEEGIDLFKPVLTYVVTLVGSCACQKRSMISR